MLVCGLPTYAHAHVPRLIETPAQNEVLPLRDPELSQALYGNLEGHPHMYEFATRKQMELFTEVLVPDAEGVRTNVSGIILRVNDDGSVTDIARLRAKEAKWESFYEPFGGDSYRRGGSYRGPIEPGLYRIEVSTPDNYAKYVLAVGTIEGGGGMGYFELVRELMKVKQFMGKSAWQVVESPFVYGPLALVLLLSGAVWWFLRRRRKAVVQ